MENNKFNEWVADIIDTACYYFLIGFAAFNAGLAFFALVFAIAEGDAFYLVGTAAGALLAWFIWSVGVNLKAKAL